MLYPRILSFLSVFDLKTVVMILLGVTLPGFSVFYAQNAPAAVPSADELIEEAHAALQTTPPNLELADSLYQLALFRPESVNRPEWFLTGVRNLLESYLEVKSPDHIVQFITKSEDWLATLNPDEHPDFYGQYLYTTQNYLAWVALQDNETEEAELLFRSALTNAATAQDSSRTYVKLGMILKDQGLIQAAVNGWKKSVALAEKSGDESVMANAYETMGLMYANSSTPEVGLPFLEKSLEIKERLFLLQKPDRMAKHNMERLYFNFAYAYRGIAQIQLAAAQNEQQIQVGLTSLRKGRMLCSKSLAITEQLYPPGDWAFVQCYLLELFFLSTEGKLPEILQISTKIDDLITVNQQVNRIEKAKAYYYLGLTLLQIGESRSSLIYTQKGLQILFPDFENISFNTNPDPGKAPIESTPIALDLLETKAMTFQQLSVQEPNSAQSFMVAERQSLEVYLEATNKYARLKDNYPASQIILQRNLFVKYARVLDLDFQLYELTRDDRYLKEAMITVEASKAFSLRRSLAASEASLKGGMPTDLLDREKRLQDSLLAISLEIQQAPLTAELELRLEYERLSQQYQRFQAMVEQNYPNFFALKYADEIVEPEEIQSGLLDPETVLIEYFQSPEYLYLFFVSHTDFSATRIPIDGEFSQNIDSLLYCLNAPSQNLSQAGLAATYPAFVRTSHFLYEQLIAPFEDKITESTRNIVIIPDSQIAQIPIEVLIPSEKMVPETGADFAKLDYLIKSYSINYGYSATTLLKNKQRPRRKNRHYEEYFVGFAPEYPESALVVLDDRFLLEPASYIASAEQDLLYRLPPSGVGPDSPLYEEPSWNRTRGSRNFGDLPGAREEVEAIAKKLRGKSIIGASAEEATFKDMASSARILHLAMHGIPDFNDPMRSVLAFYLPTESADSSQEDGFLYSSEIYDLDLTAEMVVLSACQSGAGRVRRGEGVMSLAHSFSSAGARSVIMSFWQVDDERTKELMLGYYDGLIQNAPKHLALRDAKLSILENGKEHSHPYYWSAFVNFGDPEPVSRRSGRSNNWIWILLAGALTSLALLGGWMHKKRASQSL